MAITATYDNIIQKEAMANGLRPELIKAVMKKESNFNPKCELGGAVGLMQITLSAAREVGYRGTKMALYAPAVNIKYGTKYLNEQIKIWVDAPTYDDRISMGVATYNLGQGNIRKASAIAIKKGLHPLEWKSISKVLPNLIGTAKMLTRRRINITLNYVDLVKTYMAEFNPIHNEAMEFANNIFIK